MRHLLLIAWQAVSRHRLRSALTATSIILGVIALTSVAAAEGVMQQAITRTALLTGGPEATVSLAVTSEVDRAAVATHWADMLRTRYGPDTKTARVLVPSGAVVSADASPLADAEVQLIDPDLVSIRPFEVVSGTWLSGAPHTLAPNIVLNKVAAAEHPETRDWTLRWGPQGETVAAVRVGTVDDGETSARAYLDLAQPGVWRTTLVHSGAMSLLLHSPGVDDRDVHADVQQIEGIARLTGQTGDIQRTDTVGQLTDELSTAARIFLAISVVALTIAALGMLNIGLSTLAERADELSLRRAFGAHRRDILAIMLLEAELVAVTAALFGVGIAWLAMPLTMRAFGADTAPPVFPLGAALVGVAAGAIAALLGAITPAVRATRLPIATIMRG